MSHGDTCYICQNDVGVKGGILLAKCGGCAPRNYCRDCIVGRRRKNFNCPICNNFLYLTVWTGTELVVVLTCIFSSLTAIAVYALKNVEPATDCTGAISIFLSVWIFIQSLILNNFLLFENYGPVVEWYNNVKSWIYTVVTSTYHSLSSVILELLCIWVALLPAIKTVALYVILGLLCILFGLSMYAIFVSLDVFTVFLVCVVFIVHVLFSMM